ncbi:unnamed protein product, partial [Ectocarpus sp. 12 AP-2014]
GSSEERAYPLRANSCTPQYTLQIFLVKRNRFLLLSDPWPISTAAVKGSLSARAHETSLHYITLCNRPCNMRSCTTGSYHLLQRLAGGSSNPAPFNATEAASLSVMHGSRKRLSSLGSSSGTWDLYRKYADSPEDLVELMRRIVSRGGRGRKQDNVPKEVVKVFCGRYSQLDQAGKEDLLLSMARDFTPSRESVEAAVDRYAASVSPPAEAPAEPSALAAGAGAADGVDGKDSDGRPQHQGVGGGSTELSGRRERGRHVRAYERLREELSPAYEALLKNVVAESDDGVRFVVDLRQ